MSSNSGSGDKFGVFLLGMLAGMAALSYLSERPRPSRRYEDYQRERKPQGASAFMADPALGFVQPDRDLFKR